MHLEWTNNTLLSIIMPVYNAEKYLRQAIESIVDQSYQEWELHICDDKSTDRSWEIIKQFEAIDDRIFIYQNEENQGKVKSVNSLLERCNGKYLTIHDADDWSDPKRFGKQINFLESNQDYLGCGTFFFTHKKKKIVKRQLSTDSKKIKSDLVNSSQIHGPTLVFRSYISNSNNYIYRDYFEDYNEDYDLCVRLAHLGKLTNLNEHLYHYRSLPDSLSKRHNLKRMCSSEIMSYLIKQRILYGKDDVDKGDYNEIQNILNKKQKLYDEDKSLPIREHAEILFHSGFIGAAVIKSLKAILTSPLKVKNYRLLQFIIRKRLLQF
ncbi:MAG: hypothetical protein DSY77_01895 [Bacteroidetes bacterium]|nr:MAG: hypothetical protein DSY77_01895 [Bacteroidota bacterium]